MKHDEIAHLIGFCGEASEEAVDARGLEVAAGCFMAGETIPEEGVSLELSRRMKNAWGQLCRLNPIWARELSFDLLQPEIHSAGYDESIEE